MSIKIYNTLTRRKEMFEPLDPARVTLYACGPTVYSDPHIGNARPAVVFDLLFRVLRRAYPGTVYARNFTDIDDKINASARAEGVPIGVIADRYIDAYHRDMAALGVLEPTLEPRATDNVPRMIDLTERLIERGHAYEAESHVLFSVQSYPEYGRLSNQDRENMIEGARIEVAPFKRDPVDFVLWKPSTPEQPGWDSPWGRGRPGWHLECTAMIEEHLGQTVDIHAGGQDLIFPHHENEIAQGVCAHDGALYSRYWMHNGFVNVQGDKMSKSIGNVLLVRDLLEQAPGEAIRAALLVSHYRSPLDWSREGLAEAARRLDRLYNALAILEDVAPAADPEHAAPPDVVEALEDDLNTPIALAHVSALASRAHHASSEDERAAIKAGLLGAGRLLGILQQSPGEWRSSRRGVVDDVACVEDMVGRRDEARRARDFALADRLRDELAGMGVVLEDGPDGTTWHRASPAPPAERGG